MSHQEKVKAREAGFSMIEMMVSLTVMLVLMAAAFSLVGSGLKSAVVTSQSVETQSGTRNAQEYFVRDLLSAGDGLRGITSVRVPKSFVQNYLARAPVSPYTANGVEYVDIGIITSDNATGGNNISGLLPDTDRMTVLALDNSGTAFTAAAQKEGTTANGTILRVLGTDKGRFRAGEVYMFTAGYSAVFLVARTSANIANTSDCTVTFDSHSSINHFGLNVPGQIDYVTDNGRMTGVLTRMRIINYFVDNQETLMRRVWGGRRPNGFANGITYANSVLAGTPVMDHVKDLQFRYSLSTTDEAGNLLPPVEGLTTPAQLQNARTMEITIEAETVKPVVAAERKRVTTTNSVAIRNLQFFQAQ